MLLSRAIKRLLSTRYPSFLFGMPLRAHEIPVFIYHDVEVESFTADLQFLTENRYRTLSTEEFVGAIRGGAPDRCVLLTFDDARRNFFDVAFPLLQQYGIKATLF